MPVPARQALASTRRAVVKVGSALLAADNGAAFGRLAAQVAAAWAGGVQIVVVSSGAIALGYEALGLAKRPRDLPSLQAAAAIGQSRLMWRWAEAFSVHDRAAAQILVTHADVEDRRRYLNARHALDRLLAAGVVPIVNENDTVAVDEIKFGDNDNLAADIAGLVSASAVVLLTSVDGLYTADPGADPTATRLSEIDSIDDRVRAMAGGASQHGTGGMITKIQAAERARRHGASTVIAPGGRPDVLGELFAGQDVGTVFLAPAEAPVKARKRWIATALRPAGTILVDDGAVNALRRESSLLSAGVREVRGTFDVGDAVDIAGLTGAPIARGLVALSSDDLRRVAGLRTAEARDALGPLAPDEVIHRDDLVVLG